MSCITFKELLGHCGHNVELVYYGPKTKVKGKRKPLTAPNTWNAGTPAAAKDSKSDPSDPKEGDETA